MLGGGGPAACLCYKDPLGWQTLTFPLRTVGERPFVALGPILVSLAWLCCPTTPSSVWALLPGCLCQPGIVPAVCSAGCHGKISGRPGWGAPRGMPKYPLLGAHSPVFSFSAVPQDMAPPAA